MNVMHIVIREKESSSFSSGSDAAQKIVSQCQMGALITLDMQKEHLLTFAGFFFYTAIFPLWS